MNQNNFPDSCVTVGISVPQNYNFDPAFKLNSGLMAVSGMFDLGGLSVGQVNISSMSGSATLSNMVVSGSTFASTMSGNLDIGVR